MKKKMFICLLAIIGLSACTKDVSYYRLGIDFHEDFEGENLQVLLDGKEVLNQSVSTHHISGLAAGLSRTFKKGKHTLEVTVDRSVSRREIFTLTGDLYIGVSYDPKGASLSFVYSPAPFSYD